MDIDASREAGIKNFNQAQALKILASSPETMGALAKALGVSTAAATGIADKLEGLDYLERINGTQDRRTIFLKLTVKGRDVAERIHPQPQSATA